MIDGDALERAVRQATDGIRQKVPLPEALYHYTTPKGLMGILGNSILYFSHYGFMNDGSEMNHGGSIVISQIDRLLQDNKDDFTSDVFNAVKSELLNIGNRFEPYIFCLCEEDNLLNQWRDYAPGVAGYSIGFETKEIALFDFWGEALLRPVLYDLDIQRRIIDAVLNAMIIFATKNKPDIDDIQDFAIALAMKFHFLILDFKNDAFKNEREWRLVTFPERGVPEVPVRYRESAIGLTPYIENRSKTGRKLPIRSLLCGPSSNSHVSSYSAQMFLRDSGYGEEFPVRFSTIPIRNFR